MPREKLSRTIHLQAPGSLVFTTKLLATETTNRNVPAIDAVDLDGRRYFMTFEKRYGICDRDDYLRRMRALAKTINDECDRIESDSTRL